MKSYRWLALIAALLITVCEVLIFKSQAAPAPQKQPNVAAVADVGCGIHRLVDEPWRVREIAGAYTWEWS